MKDARFRLPELRMHHCVLLFFTRQIPFWVIYCTDAVCSLAVQTRREAEVAHMSGLFGFTVLQQL